ncbi:tetratricopeptide repeat protein [Inconstantimicrobium porci]|uniref:tetratricopeptide repeat protein n=1 Tax=Inconstantimicrobium porci TaxID=2652291 RepID=UPI001981CFB6|nr:tetratricopeptide repeat protein [Inconstantimicrobium porci]
MEIVITLVVFIVLAIGVMYEIDIEKDRYGHTMRKGEYYFDNQKYEEALKCYEYAIELDSTSPAAYYLFQKTLQSIQNSQ